MARDRTLVFSTETGRIAETPDADPDAILGDGKVRVRLEKKGRGGKSVTTVTGLAMNADDIKSLGRALKKSVGVGGAVKDGIIEIQGDQVVKVLAALEAKGLNPKRSGG
ncbi:translation initiation factor [Litorivicinus lipolyticus]|uniref:translation initiation factor n=1 Tax=Litorivicinus lipolyticus TaxID=418701 RepID=UPI003B5C066D